MSYCGISNVSNRTRWNRKALGVGHQQRVVCHSHTLDASISRLLTHGRGGASINDFYNFLMLALLFVLAFPFEGGLDFERNLESLSVNSCFPHLARWANIEAHTLTLWLTTPCLDAAFSISLRLNIALDEW